MTSGRGPSRAVQGFRAGQWAAGAVPPSVGRGLAEAVAVGLSRLARTSGWKQRRALLARHLGRVLGPGAPPPASWSMNRLVDRAVASYARYWAESLRLASVGAAELTAGLVYEHFDRLARGVDAGRGTILVLPHLGGWEWAGAELAATGHTVSVVVERLEPADLFDWFTSFREGLGMRVIPAGPGATAACVAALRENHILCLLSDRLVGGVAGVEVEFFGERTALPAGPATLALRTGAVLIPAAVPFAERTGEHVGVVHDVIDTSRRGSLRHDVGRVTQQMAVAFEELIRSAPTQWHLLQPNWPSDRG